MSVESDAARTIRELNEAGVTITLEGDDFILIPEDLIPSRLRESVRVHRSQIIHILWMRQEERKTEGDRAKTSIVDLNVEQIAELMPRIHLDLSAISIGASLELNLTRPVAVRGNIIMFSVIPRKNGGVSLLAIRDFPAYREIIEEVLGRLLRRQVSVAFVEDPESLRAMPYQDYLQTDHWKGIRQAAVEAAGHRCQLCNQAGRLEVHHRTYERRGCELPTDVIALCDVCHGKFHDRIGGGVGRLRTRSAT